uniref:Uncharacterized protein n=1 Tax=Heterorhabditis bacteriophora TaxID=37862 RepID=A0A1I7WBD3_HETBA
MVMLIDVLSFCTLISPRLNHNSFIFSYYYKCLNTGHGARINENDSFFMENRRPIPRAILQWTENGSGFLSATIRHEIILVSNFKYLLFDLYYVDMIFGIDSLPHSSYG